MFIASAHVLVVPFDGCTYSALFKNRKQNIPSSQFYLDNCNVN